MADLAATARVEASLQLMLGRATPIIRVLPLLLATIRYKDYCPQLHAQFAVVALSDRMRRVKSGYVGPHIQQDETEPVDSMHRMLPESEGAIPLFVRQYPQRVLLQAERCQ
jgi:hypothetical protein